ncbi:MAG: hypothetical protein K6V97_15005 [Actinomycetia bacterium]|nr:hypothetical protein [Actinomycetes bacterium]
MQFFIGMGVNLWVVLPSTHPGAHAARYFQGLWQGIPWALVHTNVLLQGHIVVSLILWLGAVGLMASAWGTRDRGLEIAAVAGWVGITGAGFNGGSFLNYGHEVSSLLMAAGFALAVGSYVWAWGHTLGAVAVANGEDRHA